MLKSIDRINRLIDEGVIERIYIYDGWNGTFTRKIYDLFEDRVDVIIIKRSEKAINDIEFSNSDCILFYENIINDLEFATILMKKTFQNDVFVKILTEDIFC